MWRKLVVISATAVGVSVAVASTADARMAGIGVHSGAGVGMHRGASVHAGFNAGTRISPVRTRAALQARAQMRGPRFTPPGWRHGRKVGWHCTVGARGCIPPGLRR